MQQKYSKKQSTTRQFGDLDHPLWTSDFFLTIFFPIFNYSRMILSLFFTGFWWYNNFATLRFSIFFDVFENCGLTEIFKVEKSGLNQKEKESSLLTFLESHRGWEIIIKMVLKNSVL